MRDELLLYYERELTYLRQLGAEFADKYPKIASRLVLEPDKCEDPHVERLLESFAFLAARVHLKIDDEFPEITEALLSILYPHYIRPIPSMSIVQFHVDPEQGKAPGGNQDTAPDADVLRSRWAAFRASSAPAYDTTLWPVDVTAAEWKTPDRLQPAIKAPESPARSRSGTAAALPDVDFPKLGMDSLRFYLNGESYRRPYALRADVLELHADLDSRSYAQFESRSRCMLPASRFKPVGFDEDEGMLALSAPVVCRLPAPAGVLLVSGEVLLPGPDRTGAGVGRRVSGIAPKSFS